MKMRTFYLIIISVCSVLSCDEEEGTPEAGFIKASVNGVETIYKAIPEDDELFNYIKPGAINVCFKKDQASSTYWSINVLYGHTTLDIADLPIPFTVSGPNPDSSGKSPDAIMLIVDPKRGAYGEEIAGASTHRNEFVLVIHSVANDVIKGSFQGVGHGEFEAGEFSARLVRKDW